MSAPCVWLVVKLTNRVISCLRADVDAHVRVVGVVDVVGIELRVGDERDGVALEVDVGSGSASTPPTSAPAELTLTMCVVPASNARTYASVAS